MAIDPLPTFTIDTGEVTVQLLKVIVTGDVIARSYCIVRKFCPIAMLALRAFLSAGALSV
jgi:hypothetical protein